MRSLRESLSLWSSKSTGPTLKAMPKPAAGILPHREELQLNSLWSELIRCEESCRNTMSGVRQYSEKANALQHEEETLLSKLQEIHITEQGCDVSAITEALNGLLPKVQQSVNEASDRLEGEVNDSVRDYHSLYSSVEELRNKRDALVLEHNRIQDRLEKLRLKGKRSTDVLVEKERCVRQLQEVQTQILKEVALLHSLRISYFEQPLHSYVDTQFLQYGTQAELYKTHVVGGEAYGLNFSEISASNNHHLVKLKSLNITG